jgi:D-amino peptidase
MTNKETRVKVYLMTDMEGITGVRAQEETSGEGGKYEAARRFLCSDINAAVAGAFDGGATEVVVRDGHLRGHNLIQELMDPRAQYVGAAVGNWTAGLDQTVTAAFFIGAHAMAGTQTAFLEHTQSPASWLCYSVNGRPMGEQGQFGLICGALGIPVVLVTGDEAACAEAREFFPGCETAAVKRAASRQCAITMHPKRAADLIRAAARQAVHRAGEVPPLRVPFPAEVTLEFTRTDYADGAAASRGVTRVNARTVAWTARDASEWFLW